MTGLLTALATWLCVSVVAALIWTGLFWLLERAARRRCCTGTPSTHWLADRCEDCGRRRHHPSRRSA